MSTLKLNQMFRQLVCLAHRAVRATLADAVLCSACGALYGIVFSGFGAQVRHEFTVAPHFFDCGDLCGRRFFDRCRDRTLLRNLTRAKSSSEVDATGTPKKFGGRESRAGS